MGTFIAWVIIIILLTCFSLAVISLKRAIVFLVSKQFKRGLKCLLVSCVLGGIAVFFLLPMPFFWHHKASRLEQCSRNLKQLCLFTKMYANDHAKKYPETFNALVSGGYVKKDDLGDFACPSHRESRHQIGQSHSLTNIHEWTDYAYVSGLSEDDPASCVVAFCSPENHKGKGANVLFLGGHVQWYSCQAYTNAGYQLPTFQELTNSQSLFYGASGAQLEEMLKRTKIIYPKHKD